MFFSSSKTQEFYPISCIKLNNSRRENILYGGISKIKRNPSFIINIISRSTFLNFNLPQEEKMNFCT